ncbi:single-stranded DNA-binding protein [Leucobacter chromiiresistens]|uniref:Single-stranded DNA-binding protein n=1 Tax=Leucobacter chromiiresistens TaxID=1079994 RepID=A0A1H0Y7Y0_9MICO|nr:single-stranded DNA-binding protein [Leucobacter chromiiresistens]SDQ11151.1 single-strand binding protein [Leucobacter chromiiresistens]
MAGEPLITVVGNLVADPEPRVSQAGKSWVTFRIASTPRVRDRQSGDWSDGEPLWLGCRAYGEYADNIAASLTKGMRVIVQGRLTQRSYTDNQGQQRTSLDLEVEEVGPSLRFATAQVARGQARGQVGGFGGGNAGGNQPAGQSSWGQPAAPQQQDNPWTNSGQGQSGSGGGFGGGFDDEQPF